MIAATNGASNEEMRPLRADAPQTEPWQKAGWGIRVEIVGRVG